MFIYGLASGSCWQLLWFSFHLQRFFPVNFNDSMRFFRLPFCACKNENVMIFNVRDCHMTLKFDFLKHGRLKCVQLGLDTLSLPPFCNNNNDNGRTRIYLMMQSNIVNATGLAIVPVPFPIHRGCVERWNERLNNKLNNGWQWTNFWLRFH